MSAAANFKHADSSGPPAYTAPESQEHPPHNVTGNPETYPLHQPTHDRGASTGEIRGGDWQNSLFNCSPCGSCILGTCVPCLRKSEFYHISIVIGIETSLNGLLIRLYPCDSCWPSILKTSRPEQPFTRIFQWRLRYPRLPLVIWGWLDLQHDQEGGHTQTIRHTGQRCG